jgi:hypothetical protein
MLKTSNKGQFSSKKFLYTCGCSLTNYEVIDVNKQWPKLLADKLGLECINEGISNGSNYRTFRKLVNFLQTNNVDNSVFVIQFTYPFRFEMPSKNSDNWYRINFNSQKGNINLCVHPENKTLAKPVEINDSVEKMKSKVINYTSQVEDLEFMMQIMSIVNLLERKGVEYYLTTLPEIPNSYLSFQGNETWIINNWFDSRIINHYNNLDDLEWNDFHPNLKGNIDIANAFYNGILKNRKKQLEDCW